MKKKIITIFIILIFIFHGFSYAEKLNLSAESYILMDEVSGRVLMGHNSLNKMAMASTTKIMTALIALENSNPDDIVTIDERSIDIEGSSIYLKYNEEISMMDLLYGLMLRSGNDSAIAIANQVCNTEEEFVQLMNEKAKSLNALNTNFVNPHGLSHDNHYSTAYDLALITREAFKYDLFRDIVSTKSYRANRSVNGYFLNKNKTLWEYLDGDGVKIGYTLASGRCLVSSAMRGNMRLIAVSLNAPNWFNDNYHLMDYGFDNYKPYTIYGKYQLMKKIKISDDSIELNLLTENDLIYPLSEEEKDKIKVNITPYDDLKLPIKKGEITGKIETYLDGVLISRDNLVAQSDIKKISLIDKFLKLIYN